ncbi:TPA: hypothetical protein ACPUQS_004826, partial [Klebsiella pneumoniae]
ILQLSKSSIYSTKPQKSFSYNGKTLYLSNGLKAEAVVFLEERPLYMWMFTPFYKISQSVSGPINE